MLVGCGDDPPSTVEPADAGALSDALDALDGRLDGEPSCMSETACSVPASLAHDESPAVTIHEGPLHPNGFIGDPTVLFEEGKYRMWFTSSRQDLTCTGVWYECLVQGFAHAESVDGQTWDDAWLTPDTPEARTKLVFEPSPGTWDQVGMETASVLRDHEGRLRMYYTGHMGAPQPSYPFWDAIGMAVSDDGITWERYGGGPVFAAESAWERVCCDATCSCVWGGVLEPSVLYDASAGTYHLWYAAFGEVGSIAAFRIGHATSSDGVAWLREEHPVVDIGPAGAWDAYWVSHVDVVKDPCMGYHLFYHGSGAWSDAACASDPAGCVGYSPGSIGYAWSADGATWLKYPAPVLEPAAGAWDGFFVGGPDALFRDGSLELFYFGNRDLANANAFNSEIGHIKAVCR